MKRLTFAIMAVLLSLSCASRVVNPLLDVKPAQKASYGYTADDPIRIGYTGDRQKNIRFCYNYMECLQTTDGIPLQIISRASVPDPKNEPGNKGPLGFIPRRWGGELWGGILDQYSLIAEGSPDTLSLFFDIYHKEPLLIPIGLEYIAPVKDSTSSE